MPETPSDTVVYFYHQHGPSIGGDRVDWNPPVGLGVLHDYFDPAPERVDDKLMAADSRPEFATPEGHWAQWRVIPRDTAPRGKDLAGRYPGVQVDMADHPEFLARLRQAMQFGELYTEDTTPDVDEPPLYTAALGWLADGETDPVMWARMVRHAVACGVTHPRVARELGVGLGEVYAVVTDPWREDHLVKAAHDRANGFVEAAEQEETEARELETIMEPV
ncbi:hypothetical protein Q8791_23615 [Nocardiopsis sp. CT-R113]|uniref:Uncharacterized protein n=1 Tax=Nocardiopsis codii TaxID=3065942 RepID=A0ABU7KD96_9ACTN|nr:hypothetical protein [Nocardiopsis sp. CT-R113]MEE2040208.1 hypothetical protein [Nocardiopsis sp. CT-R113]